MWHYRFHQTIRVRPVLLVMVLLLLLPSLSSGQSWYHYKITDSRDGKLYKTVHIDNKWWMAENLNYGTRIDVILNQGNNSTPEKYCYQNNELYCTTYGGLYQWDELMQYGNVEFNWGLCPSGWHVSSDGEWKQLETFLGMSPDVLSDTGDRGNTEGGMLKLTGTDYWYPPNSYATNKYGFSALPGGYRDTAMRSMWLTLAGYFWNADAFGEFPYCRGLGYSYGKIYRSYKDKRFGASVRCIKDSPYMFGRGSFVDARDGKEYSTVLIANHWWMAENLNVGTRIDHDIEQADNNSIQKYCYKDNEAYCDTFGGLYQWDEVMQFVANDKQGICPDGWHIPTDEDWMALEWATGMAENLLDTVNWRYGPGVFLQPEGGSGFDGLLGGVILAGKAMHHCDTMGYFWTSSEGINYQSACMRGIQKGIHYINRWNSFYKKNAHSVRCVRNDDEILSLSIEAEDTICSGQETTLRARTSGGTDAKSYYWWSEPAGFSSQDSIVTITPVTGTKYFLRILDGYVYIRDSVRYTILPAPDDFSITGDTSVCPANEQLEYSTSNNAYIYTWGISEDGVGTLVSSDENHGVFNWGTTPGYGYVKVTATDKVSGCTAQKTLRVEVMPSRKPEVILKYGSLLICTDSGQVYQWYHDENILKDATRQFYYAKNNETGSYTVEITWSETGCRNISNPRTFTTKSTRDPGNNESQTVFIHPNPTDGNISLEIISDYTGVMEITITGSNGRMIQQLQVNKFSPVYSTSLELGGLAEGTYLMAVKYGGVREIQQIIINK